MSTNGLDTDGRAPVGGLDAQEGGGSRGLAEGQRWYVAQTLARREAGAMGQLRAQGFHVFLPQLYKTVRHARKLRTVKAPVFPGYLFVALDLQRDRWRSINGTIGVSRLVMGRDFPAPVPAGVVETFLDHLDDAGMCRMDGDLQRGQAVRVISGPLADAIGRLVDLDGNGRVRVLLEIMGGQVVTNLARSALEAA
jgi:transcriptional antiterminator RfaH